MESKRFYFACFRDNVGSNVSFHRKNGRGYSTNISEAETYTLDKAKQLMEFCREFEMPLCAERVDRLSVLHVDHQYIPCETTVDDACHNYVAYQKNKWNGNDVYWLQDEGLPTCDFSKAKIFSKPVADDQVVSIPFSMANECKRLTIDNRDVNIRSMVTAAGLKMPDRVKKARRKKQSSGKTRWNCPGCGKISWQYNPYDFDGCNDVFCDEWRSPYA